MCSTSCPSASRARPNKPSGKFIEPEANIAFDRFLKTYQVKYPEATDCLSKDREALLAFFNFPAEHWAHIRSTNPIESTFATVRLRTDKTRGCVSKDTILALVFKLVQSAEKRAFRQCRKPHLCTFGVKTVCATLFLQRLAPMAMQSIWCSRSPAPQLAPAPLEGFSVAWPPQVLPCPLEDRPVWTPQP